MAKGIKLKPGDIINRTYEVTRFLGAGFSGEVWEVRHLFLPAHYALKLMHEEDLENEHKTSRFGAEASTLFRIDHPNLVRVRDAGLTSEGLLFTVMDLLEGETLAQMLGKGRIHPLRALKLAYDVACGLDEAHENGVIHRDVKPENIFVTTRGVAVVLDLVGAKFFNVALRTTKPPDRAGTLAYMSPEQIDGTADARGDVYALGLVLYRMLRGRHPFAGSFTNQHKLMKDQFETIPEPFAAAVGLPPWIDELVERALEKPVDLRYQTMADFARSIHEDLLRLDAEVRAGRVVVDVPLGEPPIDLDRRASAGSRRAYAVAEQPARHTTGPVMPRERITLAPGTVPEAITVDDVALDAAVTAPLVATGKASRQAAIQTTPAPVRRPSRSLGGLGPLALLLAVTAAFGLAWRSKARPAPAAEGATATAAAPPALPAPTATALAEPAALPAEPTASPAADHPPELPAPSAMASSSPLPPPRPARTPVVAPSTARIVAVPAPKSPGDDPYRDVPAAKSGGTASVAAPPAPPAPTRANSHRIFGSEE